MSPRPSYTVPLGPMGHAMGLPRLPLPPEHGRRVVCWCRFTVSGSPRGGHSGVSRIRSLTPGTVLWKMRGVEEKRALVPKQLRSGAKLGDIGWCSPVPSCSHLSMESLEKSWAKLCTLLARRAERASWEGTMMGKKMKLTFLSIAMCQRPCQEPH